MKKKKLEIELIRLGERQLLMRVREQENLGGSVIYSSKINGQSYQLLSAGCPQLGIATIYVRGSDKHRDNDYVLYNYPKSKDVDNMVKFIVEALEKLNGEKPILNRDIYVTRVV